MNLISWMTSRPTFYCSCLIVEELTIKIQVFSQLLFLFDLEILWCGCRLGEIIIWKLLSLEIVWQTCFWLCLKRTLLKVWKYDVWVSDDIEVGQIRGKWKFGLRVRNNACEWQIWFNVLGPFSPCKKLEKLENLILDKGTVWWRGERE